MFAGCPGGISVSMAQEQQPPATDQAADRALFILVFDKSCHAWCDQVRPVVAELKQKYSDRVFFAELDASESVLKDTEKTAKALGVSSFLSGALSYVPMVGVFTVKRKLVKELVGPKKKEVYISAIEKAIEQK
jgi:hypothetical protein